MPPKREANKPKRSGVKTVQGRAMARNTNRAYRAGDVLGTSTPVTVDMVRGGLKTTVVGKLSQHLALSTEQTLGYIKLSKQTFARRKVSKKLSTEESDRIWRVADIVAKATELLGDTEAAAAWLLSPAPALKGESPLERASTDIGARDVEQLIGRLEHGIPT